MYHGAKVKITRFDSAFIGKGNDQDGPGFYFTASLVDSKAYANPNGFIHYCKLTPRKLVPRAGKVKTSEVQQMIRRAPDYTDTLQDWGESPVAAFRAAVEGMIQDGEPAETFEQVWADFYARKEGGNAAYLKNMIAIGYDGVMNDPAERAGTQHVIIFNPDVVHIEKVVPIADVKEAVDYLKGDTGHWDAPVDGVPIFTNPSAKQWAEITRNGKENARLLVRPNGTIHAWNAEQALHVAVENHYSLKLKDSTRAFAARLPDQTIGVWAVAPVWQEKLKQIESKWEGGEHVIPPRPQESDAVSLKDVDQRTRSRDTDDARTSENGAPMNLKSALAALFSTTISSIVSADKVDETTEATLFLGLESGRIVLKEQGDEPLHVAETDAGIVVSGSTHAVLIGTDGVTVEELPEGAVVDDDADGEGEGEPDAESMQEWLEVAVIPRVDPDASRELTRMFDEAIENDDMDGAMDAVRQLTEAAGIDEDEAAEIAENFIVLKARHKSVYGTATPKHHPSAGNSGSSGGRISHRNIKRNSAGRHRVQHGSPRRHVRLLIGKIFPKVPKGNRRGFAETWQSPYQNFTATDYDGARDAILDWVGENVTAAMQPEAAREFAVAFDEAERESRYTDMMELIEQHAKEVGVDDDGIEALREKCNLVPIPGKGSKPSLRKKNLKAAMTQERREALAANVDEFDGTRTLTATRDGVPEAEVRVITGPTEGIEAMAGFLQDLSGVTLDVMRDDSGVCELYVPEEVAEDLIDVVNDVASLKPDDDLEEWFLRAGGKTSTIATALGGAATGSLAKGSKKFGKPKNYATNFPGVVPFRPAGMRESSDLNETHPLTPIAHHLRKALKHAKAGGVPLSHTRRALRASVGDNIPEGIKAAVRHAHATASDGSKNNTDVAKASQAALDKIDAHESVEEAKRASKKKVTPTGKPRFKSQTGATGKGAPASDDTTDEANRAMVVTFTDPDDAASFASTSKQVCSSVSRKGNTVTVIPRDGTSVVQDLQTMIKDNNGNLATRESDESEGVPFKDVPIGQKFFHEVGKSKGPWKKYHPKKFHHQDDPNDIHTIESPDTKVRPSSNEDVNEGKDSFDGDGYDDKGNIKTLKATADQMAADDDDTYVVITSDDNEESMVVSQGDYEDDYKDEDDWRVVYTAKAPDDNDDDDTGNDDDNEDDTTEEDLDEAGELMPGSVNKAKLISTIADMKAYIKALATNPQASPPDGGNSGDFARAKTPESKKALAMRLLAHDQKVLQSLGEDSDAGPDEDEGLDEASGFKLIRRHVTAGEALYTVHHPKTHKIVGLLSKGRSTTRDTLPWKAFKYDGGGTKPHTFLGAHYGPKGKHSALAKLTNRHESVDDTASLDEAEANPFHKTLTKTYGFKKYESPIAGDTSSNYVRSDPGMTGAKHYISVKNTGSDWTWRHSHTKKDGTSFVVPKTGTSHEELEKRMNGHGVPKKKTESVEEAGYSDDVNKAGAKIKDKVHAVLKANPGVKFRGVEIAKKLKLNGPGSAVPVHAALSSLHADGKVNKHIPDDPDGGEPTRYSHKATTEEIQSPNSSGQGTDPNHASNPYHGTLKKHGFAYSHSTAVGGGNGKGGYTHHTYAKGERKVGVHKDAQSGAWAWNSKKSSASGHELTGATGDKLEAHLGAIPKVKETTITFPAARARELTNALEGIADPKDLAAIDGPNDTMIVTVDADTADLLKPKFGGASVTYAA